MLGGFILRKLYIVFRYVFLIQKVEKNMKKKVKIICSFTV